MLVILHPNIKESSNEYKQTWEKLLSLDDIRLQKHKVQGKVQNLSEIYLIGNTAKINSEEIESLPAVERVPPDAVCGFRDLGADKCVESGVCEKIITGCRYAQRYL